MNGNKNVGRTEGRNNRITKDRTAEGQGESSIAPTFSKRGYNNCIRIERSNIHKLYRASLTVLLFLSLEMFFSIMTYLLQILVYYMV